MNQFLFEFDVGNMCLEVSKEEMCANKVRSKMPSETRKIRKPLMEKKRRARINDCLEELKRMLLQNKRESLPESRPSKLEKADILEQTVELMRRLTDSGAYKRGYTDAQEKAKFSIDDYENLPPTDKQRLTFHLFPPTEKSLPTGMRNCKVLVTTEENRGENVWRPW